MTAVVSVGSNLGDRRAHLAVAEDMLGRLFAVAKASPIYETDPVGVDNQPAFLNQVLLLDTDDGPTLLRAAHAVEDARGRLRSKRWGPRSLDVDVISVDAIRSDDPWLTLPHPRAHERAFVLVPWRDVDPDAVLPGAGPVDRLLRRMAVDGVRRWHS